MSAERPLIAIVGRPNVGKSTLFNRLVGKRVAIVENSPGVTRDRHFADGDVFDRPVTWVDTGGFVPETKGATIDNIVRQQAQAAVEACDVVVLVTDGQVGSTAGDEEVARYLRKHQEKPILLVVNKVDGFRNEDTVIADFHRLGLGDPIATSAEHNNGIDDLKEHIEKVLPPAEAVLEEPEGEVDEDARPIRVAIVGRPNVGKSTLVNALLGQERVAVSPIAGTTRDPIDTPFEFRGRKMVLTDTAGIRKKAAITQKVEQFSVLGALKSIENSDVAVLVLDATEPAVDQDLKIAALAEEKGRALLVVVNKWDLVHGQQKEEDFRESVKWYMRFVSFAPMAFVSAKDGVRVNKVLELATMVADQLRFRAPTPMMNKLLEHVSTEHSMPIVGGRQLRVYYATQVAAKPPTFTFMCNMPEAVPEPYKRYVANYLRETFRLKVPVRLFWRERPGKARRKDVGNRYKARDKSRRRAK